MLKKSINKRETLVLMVFGVAWLLAMGWSSQLLNGQGLILFFILNIAAYIWATQSEKKPTREKWGKAERDAYWKRD